MGFDSKLIKVLQGLFIQAFLTLGFIILLMKLSLSPQDQGGHLSHGDLFAVFREMEEGQRVPPTPVASQVILILNNLPL